MPKFIVFSLDGVDVGQLGLRDLQLTEVLLGHELSQVIEAASESFTHVPVSRVLGGRVSSAPVDEQPIGLDLNEFRAGVVEEPLTSRRQRDHVELELRYNGRTAFEHGQQRRLLLSLWVVVPPSVAERTEGKPAHAKERTELHANGNL